MTRILLISDQKIKIFNQEISDQYFIDCSSVEPYELAENFDHIGHEVDAVFINAEAIVNGSNRSDLRGIEFIFWLRLKCNYTGPIVTYGFLSAAQILGLHPKYVAIHAPGNAYWRLGDEWKEEEMPNKITKEQIENEYRPYLLPLSVENKLRHENANRWALWKYSKLCNDISAIEEIPDFASTIKDSFEKKIDYYINEYHYKKDRTDIDQHLRDKIKAARESLGENGRRKVLLVDDFASAGWGELFQKVLDIAEGETFERVEDIKKKSVQNISDEIIKAIKASDLNLILLDLRLKNEKGKYKLEDLSGFKVLKKLKSERPDIPIIIVTASNKYETHRDLEQMGVWGVWIKEGQDNNVSNQELAKSLHALLDMIDRLYKQFTCAADFAIYGMKAYLKSEDYRNMCKDSSNLFISNNTATDDHQRKLKLEDFDSCVIDTNIWITGTLACKSCENCKNNKGYSACKKKTFKFKYYRQNQMLIQRLSEIFGHKELLVHNHIYSELRDKARPGLTKWELENYDLNLIATANAALKMIEMGKAKVVEYDSRTYDKQAYADPYIIDFLFSKALGLKTQYQKENDGKSILLVTADYDLVTKVNNIKIHSKFSHDAQKYQKHEKQVLACNANYLYKQLFTSTI